MTINLINLSAGDTVVIIFAIWISGFLFHDFFNSVIWSILILIMIFITKIKKKIKGIPNYEK